MFDKTDEALHKGLIKILDDATFPLKAREAEAFIAIQRWIRDLPRKMKAKEEALNKTEEPKKVTKKKKGK